MTSFLGLIVAAIFLFVATNIDDLLLLVAIHSDHRRTYPPRAVLIGQVLGFTFIIAISLLGFWFNILLPASWLACLGFFPLFIGCKQLNDLIYLYLSGSALQEGRLPSESSAEFPRLSASWRRTSSKVAVLTLANGSDNISIYLPAFAKFTPFELITTIATFYFSLLALWSFSSWLSFHPSWQVAIRKYGPVIAPIVLVCLGAWLLSDSIIAHYILSK
jgi:cadmium resistance protein CadD (predicted permease)